MDAANLGLLMLRLAVGGTMAAHGYNHIWGGGKIKGTAGWFESLGMKPGKLHAWLASITELGAGALLALGLLTPLAALSGLASESMVRDPGWCFLDLGRRVERSVGTIDLLSNGSPYLARLVCHHAGINALNDGRMDVDINDINDGLDEIVEEAENRLTPIARGRQKELLAATDVAVLGAIARGASTPDGTSLSATARARHWDKI